jgi:eukaryotic-like serine/threonine-protein kinase
MGEVYRARDVRLERSVALKVLPESLSLEKERLQRFEKEARSASALNHPNIVTIYEVGSAEGISYIAMELVDGRNVRDLLHTGALSLRRLLPLAAQLADGLAKAHEAGIVHRDLKPENMMVTKDGFVKILDFGLAKLTQAGEEAGAESELPTMTQATEPGTILGTVGYMSPEQASGRLVDFRSDQFSFGSILYEMATGQKVFVRGTKVQSLAAIIDEEPEPLGKVNPKLPASFCWMVERCLSKDPEGRYASTKDLARDLAALRDHASEISTARDLQLPTRNKARGLKVTVGIVAAAAAGVVLFFAGNRVGERKGLLGPLPVYHQLSFRHGHITGGRFAPDGQTVVYSAAWDGQPSEIFTTRLDSPESRSLGISPAGVLAISSTGEMAISLGCENIWDPCFGTLATVPLAGGAPREVLENVGSADWSPDGKQLAVIHVVDGKYQLEYPIGKVIFKTNGFLSSLRLSPDGKLLGFVEHPARDSARGTVCVVDRSGNRRTLSREWSNLRGIAWTPQADAIAFAGALGSRRNYLGLVKLSGDQRDLARWPGSSNLSDISRDGRVMMNDLHSGTEIVAFSEASSRTGRLTWFDWSIAADLSSDGRTLLFYEFGEGVSGRFTSFLRQMNGSEPARLGEGKALALAPDQKWALVSLAEPAPHLRLLPTGVGQTRDLPGTGMNIYQWAFFLPDGRRISFVAEEKDKPWRTYLQDLEGGEPRPFGNEGLRISVASQDGKQLAGTTLDGRAFLFSTEGNGSDPRPIAGVEPGEFLVQWGADGDSVYVRGTEENPLTLYRVDLRTGHRTLWKQLRPSDEANFLEFGAGPRGVRMTPDARSLVYTYWNSQSNLYLVEGLQTRWQ